MTSEEQDSICWCDSLFCREKDKQLKEEMKTPILVEFSGNRLFDNILDIRYLYIRIFFFIYCGFIIIWNFVRFAEQGYAQWWPYYFTQWFSLFTTFYFGVVSLLHFKISKYIKYHENIGETNTQDDSTDGSRGATSGHHVIVHNRNSSKWNPNCDLSIEPPSYTKLFSVLPKNWLQDMNKIVKLAKICEIFYALILSAELSIVLIYWTTVFPSAKEWDAAELANDIHMHGVYLMMILFEFTVSTIILRYGSFVYPFCFGVVFGTWTLIHYFAKLTDYKNNRYIYPLMNWGEYPSTAIALWVFAMIFLPLIHLAMVKIKRKLLNKWIEKFVIKRKQSLNNHTNESEENFNETFDKNINEELTDNSNKKMNVEMNGKNEKNEKNELPNDSEMA